MFTQILEEINNCIRNKCYLAALALALTIPDICGKAEFPECKSGKRYIKWYTKYIGQHEKQPLPIKALLLPGENPVYSYDHPPYLSGEVVYSLRNEVLHQGNLDIEKEKINEECCKINYFSLFVDTTLKKNTAGIFNSKDEGKNQDIYFEVNILHLCNLLVNAGTTYYEQNKEKFSFINYRMQIY